MIINLPENKSLRARARYLRTHGTLSEVLLWNKIKNKQFQGLDFDRQKIIGNYIVDFYCSVLELVIEIDGRSHEGKFDHDMERNNFLIGLGLKVLHISDIKPKKQMNAVLELLAVAKDRIEKGTAPAAGSDEWFY
jgi:very-short-patch-repair endonuclease